LNLAALCRHQQNIISRLAFLTTLGLCNPSGSALKYETTSAARGDLVQHVSGSGTSSAIVSVEVGGQGSGEISALDVDFNSPVEKGRLVAEI